MRDAETMAPVYLRNWVEAEEEVTELRAEIEQLRALLVNSQYFVPAGLLRDRIDAALKEQQ